MADDRQLEPIYGDDAKPVEQDLRADDHEFNPLLEPKSAKAWLNLLQESEDAFDDYNDHCDKIDERYANLSRLSAMDRNKQFQMFWANCEVYKPSIYAKPPVPVVVPKFDRSPVYQAAAETLERCAVVAFDLTEIDELMKLCRDDLALIDRGVAWCRYESSGGPDGGPRVAIDFKNRRDFLHSISRNWREVTWVAAASYLTRTQARERFFKYTGDEYMKAEYKVDKDSKEVGGADSRERGKFWEIWDKASRRVVWVAQGCNDILDEDDPHLKLRNFFPCPKPAYGSLQRGSLVPVPDVLQYRDQLEELDSLTGRIHALSECLEAKGFYPAGGSEIADAVNTALAIKTPGRVLVPISNWAAFGGSKEVIIWMPIDQIAQTLTQCVTLRQQIIQDIYQITGLSDIMRGSTSPEETLGAQQLKTQYGSIRIRDKQQELVRLARDLVEITGEIITEKFDKNTIIQMSQTTLPTNKDIQQQIDQIVQQVEQGHQMLQSPQGQQMAQQNPQLQQQAQGMLQQAYQQIDKLSQQPTIDQVFEFLKDQRAKAFTLDIETDSTIVPDENAEKQQRAEFIGMLGQLMPQLSQMIVAEPQTAEFCGELLKFAVAPYRAGRLMEGAIDDLVTLMKSKSDQPKGPDPTTAQNQTAIQVEQIRAQTKQQSDQGDQQLKNEELQMKDRHFQQQLANDRAIALAQIQAKQGDDQSKVAVQQQKAMESREAHQMDMIKSQQDIRFEREKNDMQIQQANAQHAQKMQQSAQQHAMAQFRLANQPPASQGPIPA